ncbi:MAG: exosome complex protein Rrp42 [Candidatus Diapherotrites archaeon]|nr:exosome complex protein Rrp42 [Candidatus Micrarchaeota archaeon]MBU1939473.1 exosome complex protein Rrp42 [Candidatus Micrarchaeota archaeon]
MKRAVLDLLSEKVGMELKEGRRLDGRKLDEYRKVDIVTGISENAEGSARVRLGNTEVVAGVKLVPGTPYPDQPDQGTITVGLELLPLASPTFEAGPPREQAIELSRVIDRGIRESKCLDFSELCVREGELVWIAYIDMYAINDDGNLFDAGSLAALASLLEAKMPKLEDDKVVKGEYSGKLKVSCKPILTTFAKIGNSVVLDPSLAEENALSARFGCTTLDDETISAFQKGGHGGFTADELSQCIETSFKKGKEMRKLL